MKGFRRSHHAYISALFYELLSEKHGQKGIEIFTMGVQNYAKQRGNRMAQRAIRDGKPLDHTTYKSYAEMGPSDDLVKNVNEVLSWAPDQVIEVTKCPWNSAFKRLNAFDAAVIYCENLDTAVIRGFNPSLKFNANQIMPKSESCVHTYIDANFELNQKFAKRDKKNYIDMDYHCAHLYASYSKISTAILGYKGAELSIKVLSLFASEFGAELADRIVALKNIDFDYIYPS